VIFNDLKQIKEMEELIKKIRAVEPTEEQLKDRTPEYAFGWIDSLNAITKVVEKLTAPVVVVDMLPKIDSTEFQNWLLDGGYTETKTPKLYKKGCGYFEKRNLYRHYQNILTFGN